MRLHTKASKMYTFNLCKEGKTEFERLVSVLPDEWEERAKKGRLNARMENQNGGGFTPADIFLSDRGEIIQRNGGIVADRRYMRNKQKGCIHEISKTRGVAVPAVQNHLPEP
jgi:hypothetical protein